MKYVARFVFVAAIMFMAGCASLTAKDRTLDANLIAAVKDRQADAVANLLKEGANVNVRDRGGMTPLHWAAYSGDFEVLKALIAHGANVKTRQRGGEFTPLHFLAYTAHDHKHWREETELLLAHGAEINARDNEGSTPLFWAAWQGNKELVKLLLDKGADVSLKGKENMTVLEMTKVYQQTEIYKLISTHHR